MSLPPSRLPAAANAKETGRSGRQDGPRRRRLRAAVALLPVAALGFSLLPAAPAVAKKKTETRPIVSGWLPYWTTQRSIASLEANKDLLTEVSPFWYTVKGTRTEPVIGTQVTLAGKLAVKNAAAGAKVDLWPSFTDSTPARTLAAVMAKKKTRKALVAKMVDLAVREGYAGLDLDFEKFAFSDGSSTWATTRPAWVKFVKRLGNKLHEQGKKLAATTPPLCSMSGVCGGRNGYWVYDWSGIAPYIDRLRIMAYDYSFSAPGPIGPYPWAEAIVKGAIEVFGVPPQKVQIGVPTYGREWVRRNPNGSYMVTGTCPASRPSDYLARRTFDSYSVPSLLRSRGNPEVKWNDTYKESYYRTKVTYTNGKKKTCTVHREGWFGDARAVAARAELVGKYGIAGIAAWTIGGEDPGQWAALRNVVKGNRLPATKVDVTAPDVVRYGRDAQVRAAVTAQGTPVAEVNAKLQWRAAGSASWQDVEIATTDAAGVVAWTRPITASGTFRVMVDGTGERADGSGTADTAVRPILTPKGDALTVARGGKAKLRARLVPKTRPQVVVQRQTGARWVKVAAAKYGKAGNPRLGVRVTAAKTVFRFKAKPSATSGKALSAPITVRTR